ncbi:hypothetical protein KBG23_01180 [Candidatus Dojkabacteria bacterium]|jgi:hypothetical protein|nr:hypothetical protein [Candidatus Dojkabacteria bacterium]
MEPTVIITVTIIALIAVLFVVVSFSSKKIDKSKKESIYKRLKELELGMNSLDSSVRRDTVVKLDNLLSKSLQIYFGNKGLCGDNLKKANFLFKKKEYNDIWEAHKIRNKVVHDDYEVDASEGIELYNTYKLSIERILK